METGGALALGRHNEVFGDKGHLQYTYIFFPFHLSLFTPFPPLLSPAVLKLSLHFIHIRFLMEILDNKPACL